MGYILKYKEKHDFNRRIGSRQSTVKEIYEHL